MNNAYLKRMRIHNVNHKSVFFLKSWMLDILLKWSWHAEKCNIARESNLNTCGWNICICLHMAAIYNHLFDMLQYISGFTFGQLWISLCCGKHIVALNLFQTRKRNFGIGIACTLCLTKHMRTHMNSKIQIELYWQTTVMFNSRQKQDSLTSWLLLLCLENGSWAGTRPSRLIFITGSSWNCRVLAGKKARPSLDVGQRSVHVHLLYVYVFVRHRQRKKCVSAVPMCFRWR